MTFFVGICGGTGSGKTTLAENLVSELGEDRASIICLDSYYTDLGDLSVEEKAELNYDHPDSIDASLLAADLDQLKAGSEAASPVYDFTTHSRTKSVVITEPKEIIIVEGILLFAFESLRTRMNYLFFTHAPERTRFERRLSRDMVERARTQESVETQWAQTVKPMHDLFVEPMKHKADHIVYNTSGVMEIANDAAIRIEQRLLEHIAVG